MKKREFQQWLREGCPLSEPEIVAEPLDPKWYEDNDGSKPYPIEFPAIGDMARFPDSKHDDFVDGSMSMSRLSEAARRVGSSLGGAGAAFGKAARAAKAVGASALEIGTATHKAMEDYARTDAALTAAFMKGNDLDY